MEFQSLVNPVLQMQGILRNPINFITALINTLYADNFYIESMIGVLGWFNYTFKAIVYSLYLLIFGYAIRELISYKEKIFPSYVTLSLFLICSVSFILPFLAMYLMWTPVGYSQILGVQGRYFLILLPFILLIIHQVFVSSSKKKIEIALMWFFVFFVGSQSLMTVYLRYYKETSKVSDLDSLIKFDPTKYRYIPLDKPISFTFETKSDKKEVAGFKFYFTTHNQKIGVTYHYKLMDESCTKVYKEGDLDIKKLSGDSIYQEDFPAIWVEKNICLTLAPVSFSPEDKYISILVYGESLKFELLGATK